MYYVTVINADRVGYLLGPLTPTRKPLSGSQRGDGGPKPLTVGHTSTPSERRGRSGAVGAGDKDGRQKKGLGAAMLERRFSRIVQS
jgi:hypothetical protein